VGKKHPNARRLKGLRTYTVEELAHRLDVHVNSIRAWRREGLEPVDESRPLLFRGDVVVTFLNRRRASSRQPCGPGRLYCLPCRAPKRPAGGMADYLSDTATAGTLAGICPDCDRMMFRRVARDQLPLVRGSLDLQPGSPEVTLMEGPAPFSVCDFPATEHTR
jgi:hypothetical protein